MGRRRRDQQDQQYDAFGDNATLPDVDGAMYDGILNIDRSRPHTLPVEVNNITADERIQVRIGGINPKTVEQYANILLNGGEFSDRIVVFRTDEDDMVWLSDGFHRLEAYRLAYATAKGNPDLNEDQFLTVPAEVRYGGFQEAFEFSEEANLKHGLQLSNKDKYNILLRRIQRGHLWDRASANSIAKELGITDKTADRWRTKARHELGITSDNSEVVTADGRVMKTGNIGPKVDLSPQQQQAKEVTRLLGSVVALLLDLGYSRESMTFFEDWTAAVRKEFEVDDE